MVMLSALEIDANFPNANVMTGSSNGVLRGASGGYSDITAAGPILTIITAPLVRGRIPCVVEKSADYRHASVDVLVTDHGIAVNPVRQDLIDNLRAAGVALMTEQLQQRAEQLDR